MRSALLILTLFAALGAGTAPAQVKLERKYAEGATVTTQDETKSQQVLTLGGMDIETKASQFVVTKLSMGKRAADGTLPLTSRIDKLQAEYQFPGGVKMAFDSGAPDKPAEIPMLEPILQVLRASAKMVTTVILDKANQVQSVDYDKKLSESVDENFKSQFNPDRIKKALTQEMNVLPDKPVSKGDTWIRTTENDLGIGQTLTLTTRYEYAGTEDKDGTTFDKITLSTTDAAFAQDQTANSPAKVTSSELKVAESSGTILFDRERGAITLRNSKFRIKGDIKLSFNGMEIPGNLDLTIEAKHSMQP